MSICPKIALLEEYALVARALSAPARLSLLEQLAQGERGVEALAEKTGLTIANCSQHPQHHGAEPELRGRKPESST